MIGQRFLVAFPSSVMPLVALIGRQPAKLEAVQNAPDAGLGDRDVVIPLEVHHDLVRTEVVVLPQVDDLRDDVAVGPVSFVRLALVKFR